jgi:hypothetical protein
MQQDREEITSVGRHGLRAPALDDDVDDRVQIAGRALAWRI